MVSVREAVKMAYSAWQIDFVWVGLDLFECQKKSCKCSNIDLIVFILIQRVRETVERQGTYNRVEHAMLEKSARLMVTV